MCSASKNAVSPACHTNRSVVLHSDIVIVSASICPPSPDGCCGPPEMWGARAISPATTTANDSPFSIWPLIYIAIHGSSAVRCMHYWLDSGVVAVNLCTGPLATQDSCGALIPLLLCVEDLVRLLNCTASLCSPVQGEYVCMLSSCPVCHQTAAWRQHETHAVLHTRHRHICGGARVCESHRPGSVSNRAPDVAQQPSELQL